jgi:hypothetical protein
LLDTNSKANKIHRYPRLDRHAAMAGENSSHRSSLAITPSLSFVQDVQDPWEAAASLLGEPQALGEILGVRMRQ